LSFEQFAGVLAQALLLAAVIAYPLARVVLRRYTTVVGGLMKAGGAATTRRISPDGTTSSRPSAYSGSEAQLRRDLTISPWRAAGVQALAALGVAVSLAILFSDALSDPAGVTRVVALTVPLLWPGIIAVMLSAGMTGRQRAVTVSTYVLACAVVGILTLRSISMTAVAEFAKLLLLSVPPTVYLAPFFTRRMRAAGPLILLVTLPSTIAAVAALPLTELAPLTTTRTFVALQRIPAELVTAFYIAVVALVALLCGRLLLSAIARAYANRRIGDDTIALSALCLTFIVYVTGLFLVSDGVESFLLGLCAYPLYLGIVWLGNRAFRPAASDHAPTLLLLRVFASKGPTESLFHDVGRHWLHVGPMTMIAGWDLTSTTIEPDEILKYWRGDTADLFLTGKSETIRRLDASKRRRDIDGRFGVEKRYCSRDVWETMAERLIASSSVILIDLRQLGRDDREHKGIRFELKALERANAVSRAVILRNDSAAFTAVLRDVGADLSSASVLDLTGDAAQDRSLVLEHLAMRCDRIDGR